MSTIHQRGPARIAANLTPMIDVTFLLIVFFVVVSQIVEVDNIKLEPPRPDDPATEVDVGQRRVVVNVVPGIGDGALAYRCDGQEYAVDDAGQESLRAALERMYRANPVLAVNLRADRRTAYVHVEPVMQLVAEAADAAGTARGGEPITAQVNLVVAKDDAAGGSG